MPTSEKEACMHGSGLNIQNANFTLADEGRVPEETPLMVTLQIILPNSLKAIVLNYFVVSYLN